MPDRSLPTPPQPPGALSAGFAEQDQFLRLHYRIASALKVRQDPVAVLGRILEAILELDGIDAGGIYTFEPSTGDLVLRAHAGLSDAFIKAVSRYPADSAHARLSLQGQPIYSQASDASPTAMDDLLAAEGLQARAVIPATHDGRVTGVLNLASHTCADMPAHPRLVLEAAAAEIGTVIATMFAEMALRESQQNLSALFDTIDDFLFILDANGRILKVNRAVERRLGYREAELVGREVLVIHPAERLDEARRVVDEVLSGARQYSPLPFQARTGELIPVETRVTPGSWGGQPALFGISRDISGRLHAERLLKEEHEFARTVMETVAQGLAVTGADGLFAYVNPAYARMAGRSVEALLTMAPHDVTADADIDRLNQACTERRGGGTSSYESRMMRPDGTTVDVLVSGAPRWHGGRIVGAVAIISDLTEQKRAEAERLRLERQALRAEKRASLGAMAAGVAHHFNNQLTAILGGIEMARLHEPPDSHAREWLDDARQSAGRAAEICQQMLTYLGLHGSSAEAINLAPLVQAAADAARRSLPPGTTLDVEVGEQPLAVRMESADLTQVLQILVTNAGEALGRAGRVRLVLRELSPADLPPEQAHSLPVTSARLACIEVHDTGSGMDAAALGRLFDPFFSTKLVGRGLGLPVALGLVRSAGGVLLADSHRGKGTCMRVILPCVEADGRPEADKL
jgi:PAS domain S-box-containing protein